MPGGDCSHVGQTVIAHFNIFFIADFMQVVVGWKMFSKQSQEFSTNVGCDMHAVL